MFNVFKKKRMTLEEYLEYRSDDNPELDIKKEKLRVLDTFHTHENATVLVQPGRVITGGDGRDYIEPVEVNKPVKEKS